MNLKTEINNVYEKAIQDVNVLKKKKKDIVNTYIKNLEQKKIDSIRKSLDLK